MTPHTEVREGLQVFDGDIDDNFMSLCLGAQSIAWDIETSGLDWNLDAIGTCQLAVGGELAIVQITRDHTPRRLARLLAERSVRKVFHHAPFDLRFMSNKWRVIPANVACTKIASKILHPELDSPEHSLLSVLDRTLGVTISKDQRLSDWRASELTEAQLAYAANDVRYLNALLTVQLSEAYERGLEDDVERSFAYLPTRVALDLRGVGDVYAY